MTARQLPPLSALRAFEAAARHASAKRAAEELHVTPTAISHQLRALEAWLGTPLFLRRPRQLAVTPAGQELQAVLGASLDAIAAATARLRAAPRRQSVTLSTTPAVAARWLMPRLDVLRDAHPQLDLRVHATHEPVPLDGRLADVAVRYGVGPWPGLDNEPLFDNVFVPACSPALGLRRAADLPRHVLLHFEPRGARSSTINWPGWQARAQVPGLDASAGPVFSDETHAIAAALGGQGVALMSRALIADELARGTLVQPFGPEWPGAPFHLVWPSERADEPAVRAVRDWVATLRRELEAACDDLAACAVAQPPRRGRMKKV